MHGRCATVEAANAPTMKCADSAAVESTKAAAVEAATTAVEAATAAMEAATAAMAEGHCARCHSGY
jgi:mono/diheme cytochrome c family protein